MTPKQYYYYYLGVMQMDKREYDLFKSFVTVDGRDIEIGRDGKIVFSDNKKLVSLDKINPMLKFIKVKRLKEMLHTYELIC